MDNFLSTEQACEALGLPRSTLMGRIYNGKIRAQRKGWCWYISREEIARVLGLIA